MEYSTETVACVCVVMHFLCFCLFVFLISHIHTHTHVHSVSGECEAASKHACAEQPAEERSAGVLSAAGWARAQVHAKCAQPVGGCFHLVIPARLEAPGSAERKKTPNIPFLHYATKANLI